MDARGLRRRRGGGARALRVAAAAWALQACASGPPAPPPLPEWNAARSEAAAALEASLARDPQRAAGVLRVRLVFPGTVDLDLYVTDPRLETLYYANTPTRSGGLLAEDRRCDADAAPRTETAHFASPLAGRYRVGVDYPSDCDAGEAVVPFVLSIEWEGGRRELRGLAEHLRFDTVVTEFELP